MFIIFPESWNTTEQKHPSCFRGALGRGSAGLKLISLARAQAEALSYVCLLLPQSSYFSTGRVEMSVLALAGSVLPESGKRGWPWKQHSLSAPGARQPADCIAVANSPQGLKGGKGAQ